MRPEDIARRVDHTLLRQDATEKEIDALCAEAIEAGAASVCIPPCYVARAKELLRGRVAVCTVIGFPEGYATSAAKAAETRDAVSGGADEIDMVMNVAALKSGRLDLVTADVTAVRAACAGKVLKVILECCLLTDEEKRAACRCAAKGGADYVKTSTGFSTGGATVEDVRLMRASIPNTMKIKAAGGIRTVEQAEAFIAAGADRIGSSGILKSLKRA